MGEWPGQADHVGVAVADELDPIFFKLPRWLRKTKGLPWGAKAVAAALWTLQKHYPHANPGVPWLAFQLGMTQRGVQKALRYLDRQGLLEVKPGRLSTSAKIRHVKDPTTPSIPSSYATYEPSSHVPYEPSWDVASIPSSDATYEPSSAPPLLDQEEQTDQKEGWIPFPLALDFQRKATPMGVWITKTELRHVNPLFGAGVPVQFALDLLRKHWIGGSPWGFASAVWKAWGGWTQELHQCHDFYAEGEGQMPTERMVEHVKKYATAEQIAWVRGQDSSEGKAGEGEGKA